MTDERELLDRLIKQELGAGKAEFEVNVGFKGKNIDLVFEKKDEIWLIEAKKQLNYEALGQVLTYKELYLHQVSPSKDVKLGIVCTEGDSEIEAACKSVGIQVFILNQVQQEQMEEAPICTICGSQMVKENAEFKCKTCEYFFGMSSMLCECIHCGAKFGSYPRIERDVEKALGPYYRKSRSRMYCLNCNKERGSESYGTLSELLKEALNRRDVTPYQLEVFAELPKEFIDYCLGRMKPCNLGALKSSYVKMVGARKRDLAKIVKNRAFNLFLKQFPGKYVKGRRSVRLF